MNAVVSVPGSKSYTQRALLIATLARGESYLRNALIAEDTRLLIDALRTLGTVIVTMGDDIIVTGTSGRFTKTAATIYLGNNGTALRFLTSLASLGGGPVKLDGSARLRQRPIKPLIEALNILGITSQYTGESGYPPVTIRGGSMHGGKVIFTDAQSSQYVSSILITAPYARGVVEIELRGKTSSLPYISMTVSAMNQFGVRVTQNDENTYRITTPQRYTGRRYLIEGDISSASYFFCAAAICKGKIRVVNLNPSSVQGDMGFLDIIEKLGCHITKGEDWIEVVGDTLHRGELEFDMADMPDMVPTLAVVAAFRKGRTAIKNVAHLRLKESNRIRALINELRRIGIDAGELPDGIIIDGGTPHGAEVETYDDHRIAMSFAIAGLATEGIKIKNKLCVTKSFPGFWNELKKLYQ